MLEGGVDELVFRDTEDCSAALEVAADSNRLLVEQLRMLLGRVQQCKIIDGAAFGRKQRVQGLKPINLPDGESCIDDDRFKNLPLRYIHALRQSAIAEFVTSTRLAVKHNDALDISITYHFSYAARTKALRAPSPHHGA